VPQPRPTVPGPTPTPLGYGLLPCAAEVLRADSKARYGVQFEPITGTTGGVATITDGVGRGTLTPETFDDTDGQLPLVETDPFLIYAGVEARLVGRIQTEAGGELEARARTKLGLTAGRWIERGFQPQLLAAAVHPEISSNTAVDPDIALGLLEEWMADVVGALGVIHIPRRGIGVFGKHVAPSGTRQQTKLGQPVAFGTGYRNLAPGGGAAAAGTVWVWATGPVQVNRSGIEPLGSGAEAMTLRQNSTTVYATEVVSVGYEAGAVAVPVKYEVENP
jgi:hypothetical protein